jgi:elongation factor P hydroxylase
MVSNTHQRCDSCRAYFRLEPTDIELRPQAPNWLTYVRAGFSWGSAIRIIEYDLDGNEVGSRRATPKDFPTIKPARTR